MTLIQRVEIAAITPSSSRVRIEAQRIRVQSWVRLLLGDRPAEWARGLDLSLERLKAAVEAPDQRLPDLPYMPAPRRVFAAIVFLSVVAWVVLLLVD